LFKKLKYREIIKMSDIIKVVPDDMGLGPEKKRTIDDQFDKFLDALNVVQTENEKTKRARYEAELRDKYTEWARILQSVNNQFKAVAGVFSKIEERTDNWVMFPSKQYRD